MISTTTMVQRLRGLLDTDDLTEWEQGFVSGLVERMDAGQITQLTERQVTSLERLHNKHFSG